MYNMNNHSKLYFKNLKDFLEAQQSKTSNVLYRNKLMEHQKKINYTNEVNRIRGELSRNDTRLPMGTRKTLEERVANLKKLGAYIAD